MSASSTEKILGKSKKKKSKKGLIIGISIAAAAAALLLITYGLNVVPGKLIRDKLSPAADTADETAYMPVTATAVVMDVQQKLTVTGKVISNAEQIANAGFLPFSGWEAWDRLPKKLSISPVEAQAAVPL